MATVEESGELKFKDAHGNTTILYPITLKANVSGMTEIDNLVSASKPITMISSDGVAYTCTVPGITDFTVGVNFIGVPTKASNSQSITLNVNGLGAKNLRRRVSSASTTTSAGYTNDWLSANKPVRIMYDGLFWIVDMIKPSANDLLGTVPVSNGGTGSNNGAMGLANLLSAGNMVLSAYQYGDELPAAGTLGRVFFKRVTD